MQIDRQDSFEKNISQHHNQPQEEKSKAKPTLKQRKAARRARQLVGKNIGRWSLEERRQYYVFLKIYSQFFVSKHHRRNDKVFRIMANFLKTRTPDQCRTHHQKLQFKYFKLSKILQVLKNQFGPIDYQEIVKKCETASTNVNTPTTLNQRDATFNQCQNTHFIQKNHTNHIRKDSFDIHLKQPINESSKKSLQIIDFDNEALNNFVSSLNTLLD